jgi:hypothetical protein
MLYEFAKDIRGFLAAKKYPVAVRHGPDRVTRELYPTGHVVVFERDAASGDKLGPPATRNEGPGLPPFLRAVVLGCKATIYARSSLPNAHRGDHERETEKIRDAVLCAMYKWGVAGRVGDLPVSKMGYVENADKPEVWPGLKYEIIFGLPRGVKDREYVGEQNAGAGGPTGAPTGVGNTTVASAPGVAPATGCDSA